MVTKELSNLVKKRNLADRRCMVGKCFGGIFYSTTSQVLRRTSSITKCFASSQSNLGTRTFASMASAKASSSTGGQNSNWLHEKREALLTQALKHVPEHGWTDDALIEGANDIQIPATMIASVHSGDEGGGSADERLVQHHMDSCYRKLDEYIKEQSILDSWNQYSPAQKIFNCIQYRLRMNIPLMSQNGRWAEAMVIGAKLPTNASKTASQIDNLIDRIGQEATKNTGRESWNFVERSMVASVYVMTELHLLQACALNNTSKQNEDHLQDTWSFLQERVQQLEFLAEQQQGMPRDLIFGTKESVVATAALASSLGTAVLSLLSPTATTFSRALPLFQTTTSSPNQLSKDGYRPSTTAPSPVQTPSTLGSSTQTSFNRASSNLADPSSSVSHSFVKSKESGETGRNIVHGIDLDTLPPFPSENPKMEQK